ncbi:MAG: branched-chain amino acid ABC transporter permease [Deltaproteobacteria bacterium]|jgi:branched-chain amino acid transport system permease protein|nr:branched-chain amino acid ABC transporter permease [Deltaproteobacteria bacterium]
MKRGFWILAVVIVLFLPWVGNNYFIRLATIMMLYCVLALSWNFIGGLTGYPSFATAAFFGLGAYAGGVAQGQGIPMYIAWIIGAALAALFATGLGLAILRLRGHYFAIASLVVADVLREIVNSTTNLTGGGMGLNLPILKLGVDAQAKLFYYCMFAIALLTLFTAAYVMRRPLGFGLGCIKQNEDAANIIGINATIYKTIAFGLSAVFVGGAGAFYASWVSYIEPGDVFDILFSIKPIVMVLLGKTGTLSGPILGAIVFLVLEELVWRNFLTFHAGVLGLIVVFLILYLPDGMLAIQYRRWFAWRKS